MKNPGRVIAITLFFFYLAGLIWFTISTLLQYPAQNLLTVFHASYISQSALSSFLQYFIPLTAAGILAAFSFTLVPSNPQSAEKTGFARLGQKSAIILIIIMCAYVLVRETGGLRFKHNMQSMTYLTSVARNAENSAVEFNRQGRYDEALERIDLYLAIDSENQEINALRESIQARIHYDPQAYREETGNEEQGMAQTADFFQKAQYFYRIRDYYTAHHNATMALHFDPRRADIRNLAELAWRRIEEMETSARTASEAAYHARKRAGYLALQENRAIDAYYIFNDLFHNSGSTDPDVRRYLAEARQRVSALAYFIDEMEDAEIIPGIRQIFVVNNPDGPSPDRNQFLYLDRYAATPYGDYAWGVEILETTNDGTVLLHVHAPFAKIIESYRGRMLLLKGISRDNPDIKIVPEYLQKTDSADFHFYPLFVDPQALAASSLQGDFPATEHLATLLTLRASIEALGYTGHGIDMEILERIIDSFSFLIFGFLAMSAGWILRIKAGKQRFFMFPVFPVLPFVLNLVYELYRSANTIFYLYFLLNSNFILSVLLVITLSCIQMALSLFLLGLQVRDQAF